jgi:hypothetical protein
VNKKNSLILAAIAVIVIGAIAYQIVQTKNNNQAADAALQQTVENDDLGLLFSYAGGPDGFTLVEPPAEQKGILKAYLLLPTKAYEEYKTREVPGEAPAGMNVFVFTLDEGNATNTEAVGTSTRPDRMTRLKEWATTNTTVTSFTQAKSEPETVEIDGLKMLKYKADGLYQQEVYLGSYQNKAFMFVGQYNEETDMTFTQFQAFMQTVSFN